jgi:hypothetical protein
MNVFNGNMATFNSFMGCPTTGIKQSNLNDAVILYPNPASNSFQIDDAAITGEAIISIYDINGRSVFSKSIANKTVIDVTNLKEGIYTVTIKTLDSVINKKLVIVH